MLLARRSAQEQEISGDPIRIHPLFLLILFTRSNRQVPQYALAFSVLLHELAHILTAFGFGYRTTAVELFPLAWAGWIIPF